MPARRFPLPLLAMAALASTLQPRTQTISFARHGQAQHNVRAERMRDEGCDFDAFIAQMKVDDAFDAELTERGREEARAAHAALPAGVSPELVVASPLSRAIETARILYPDRAAAGTFVAVEELREWSGQLENGRRRPSAELAAKFPGLDVAQLPADETNWDPVDLEAEASVAARGLAALAWLAKRPEDRIAVVAHGGLLAVLFDGPHHGGHTTDFVDDPDNVLGPRFANCEVRTVRVTTHPGPRYVVSRV